MYHPLKAVRSCHQYNLRRYYIQVAQKFTMNVLLNELKLFPISYWVDKGPSHCPPHTATFNTKNSIRGMFINSRYISNWYIISLNLPDGRQSFSIYK